MPNWCGNTLSVWGETKQIKKFYKQGSRKNSCQVKNRESELSLDNFLPTPKGYYTNGKWYDWHIKNWGTKWDLVDVELMADDEEYLEYQFSTAWSPCSEAIKEISKMFPKLNFRLKYEENGAGFLGVAKYCKGEGTDNCLEL